jgi:site-specific DNA-methyltransferase (adenine-specific)/adenine-specific DNA-methyltransferase
LTGLVILQAGDHFGMPTLDWIGKKAVVNHHREVPYHLLKCDKSLSVGDPGSGNLLVQGDNLLALKALLPYYAGLVKCIYIDPPYNTGDENWAYNDAVNSPEMRNWLGKVVGKEAEDLSRHDKWLCMMYPRLSLLRQFLRRDGVIFVSIDENEVANLRLLMDETFGPRNSLGSLVWKRRSSSAMRGTPLSIDHEYLLAYGYDADHTTLYGLAKAIDDYPHEDERGHYASTDLTVGMGKDARPGQFYTITNPRTGKTYPPNPERVWRFWPETMAKVIADDLVIWPDEAGGRMERPRYKTYFDPHTSKPKPVSSWIETANTNDREIEENENDYEISILTSGMTQEGGKLLQQMLGSKVFAYPKPLSLVRSLIRAATRHDDLILDSFAGTGTTGHAVLDLNQEDEGQRRFLLVEMESDICEKITRVRLRGAVEGYSFLKPKGGETHVEGLGGGFRYCRLGDPVFDETGSIREGVTFGELAAHVYFAETGEPLPKRTGGKTPLLGVHNGKAIYLLFNGILGDRSFAGGNVLTNPLLKFLPPHDGPRTIFGEGCRLGAARLKREGIVFKQIPYGIKVS